MIQLSLDTREFDRDLKKFAKKNHRDFVKAVHTATTKMHYLAVFKVYKTRLKQHIRMIISGKGLTGDVVSQANYSQALEEGTKPHTIRVKSKKVLAGPARLAPSGWTNISGDYAIYGKEIQHPGTKAQPFMMPSFMTAKRLLYRLIEQAL